MHISLDGEMNDSAMLSQTTCRSTSRCSSAARGSDVLVGADGSQDLACGLGGADTLDGRAGADIVLGGRRRRHDRQPRRRASTRSMCGDDADTVLARATARRAGADDCETRDLPPVETPTATPTATAHSRRPPPTLRPDADADPTATPTPIRRSQARLGGHHRARRWSTRRPVVRVSLVARVARERFLRRRRRSRACAARSRARCRSVLTLDIRTAKRLKLPRRLARATRHLTRRGPLRVTVKPNASVRRRLRRVKGTVKRDADDDRAPTAPVTRAHGHQPAAAQPLNDRSPMPMARTAGAPSTTRTGSSRAAEPLAQARPRRPRPRSRSGRRPCRPRRGGAARRCRRRTAAYGSRQRRLARPSTCAVIAVAADGVQRRAEPLRDRGARRRRTPPRRSGPRPLDPLQQQPADRRRLHLVLGPAIASSSR